MTNLSWQRMPIEDGHLHAHYTRYFGDDLDAEVWRDENAVRDTEYVAVPWFWTVRHVGMDVVDGNARSLAGAKWAAGKAAREIRGSTL